MNRKLLLKIQDITGGIVFGIEGREPSLESWFKAWRKKQTTTSFVVECKIVDEAEVIAAIIAAGGKVTK